MVKLTPQLIDDAVERTNPIRERELILRGLKFSVIENLGIALDMYDSYDMCDNDIMRFGNFPNLVKCQMIYANNNRVSHIGGDIWVKLPNINEISLINNEVRSFTDIKRLEKCSQLKYLTLIRNPITLEDHYRRFVIYVLPQLKFLDFNRVKEKEKADAKNFFENQEAGKLLYAKICAKFREEAENIFFEDDDMDETNDDGEVKRKETDGFQKRFVETEVEQQMREIDDEQRSKIKAAILKATSIEEVERLNRMLQAGYIPE